MNQRKASRKEWASSSTLVDINSGSLQRIADACEKMVESYDQMRNSRDFYEQLYKSERELSQKRYCTISALRGQITRLKRLLGQ